MRRETIVSTTSAGRLRCPVTWPHLGRLNAFIQRSVKKKSNYLQQKNTTMCSRKWQRDVDAAVPAAELEHLHQILGNTMNTYRTSNQTNQFFIKFNIFVSFTIFRFIENRRRVVYGEASRHGSCFPRVVDGLTRPLHCFRGCLMFHIVCRYCCSILLRVLLSN